MGGVSFTLGRFKRPEGCPGEKGRAYGVSRKSH